MILLDFITRLYTAPPHHHGMSSPCMNCPFNLITAQPSEDAKSKATQFPADEMADKPEVSSLCVLTFLSS